ncbi:MAG: hypothetical protein H0W44_08845 [Gammaproteobacteria bacterium]|nr:hypothetical protein [Gammaproteobacteria bacterium]
MGTFSYQHRITDWVEYTVAGEFPMPLMLERAQHAVTPCQDHQIYKMLFDMRGLEGHLTIAQRYWLSSELPHFWDSRLQTAVLGLHHQVLPSRFGEKVANNRGVYLKVFTDYSALLQWLLGSGHAALSLAKDPRDWPGYIQ